MSLILARECASLLQGKTDELAVKHFVGVLGDNLRAMVNENFELSTHTRQREKIWMSFHHFRSDQLGTLWHNLHVVLRLPDKYRDPWLIQVVARLREANSN